MKVDERQQNYIQLLKQLKRKNGLNPCGYDYKTANKENNCSNTNTNSKNNNNHNNKTNCKIFTTNNEQYVKDLGSRKRRVSKTNERSCLEFFKSANREKKREIKKEKQKGKKQRYKNTEIETKAKKKKGKKKGKGKEKTIEKETGKKRGNYEEGRIALRIEKARDSTLKKKTLKCTKQLKALLVSNQIPIFSPSLIISVPFCISIFFFIISFVLLFKIQNVIECSVSYSDPINSSQGNDGDSFFSTLEEVLYIKITQYDCKGIEGDKTEITSENNLYLYYELKNFYQSDRTYLKDINENNKKNVDCNLYYKFNNEKLSICSLKMLSVFNDTFALFQNVELGEVPDNFDVDEIQIDSVDSNQYHNYNDNSNNNSNNNSNINSNINRNNIYDINESTIYNYNNINIEQIGAAYNTNNRDLQHSSTLRYMGTSISSRNVIPQNEIELEQHILNLDDFKIYKEPENEQNKKVLQYISSMFFNNKEIVEDRLCVWLTNSVSKNVKKPYAKIKAKTLKFPFYIRINNRYSVESFGGKKQILITGVSNFGSRNFFLFYFLLINAFLCLITAIYFFARNRKNIRIIGDARHFHWGRFD